MLKCPQCKQKTAYKTYGIDTPTKGKFVNQRTHYKQKHCASCGYHGNKTYLFTDAKWKQWHNES